MTTHELKIDVSLNMPEEVVAILDRAREYENCSAELDMRAMTVRIVWDVDPDYEVLNDVEALLADLRGLVIPGTTDHPSAPRPAVIEHPDVLGYWLP